MPLLLKKCQDYQLPLRTKETYVIARAPLCRWLFTCLDLIFKGVEKDRLLNFICDPFSEILFKNERQSSLSKKIS